MNRLTVFHGNNLMYFFLFFELHFCILAKAQACISVINKKLLRVLHHLSSGH